MTVYSLQTQIAALILGGGFLYQCGTKKVSFSTTVLGSLAVAAIGAALSALGGSVARNTVEFAAKKLTIDSLTANIAGASLQLTLTLLFICIIATTLERFDSSPRIFTLNNFNEPPPPYSPPYSP